MATKIIGLDLGQREVRAWLMESSFSSRESKACFYRAVNRLEGESILEAQLRATNELLEIENLTHETYAMPLPRHLTSILTHRLPIGQLKLIDEVLPGELEDLLPLELEDIFYDYQITHLNEEEIELLIAYAIREELDQFFEDCLQAGIDPKVLTLGSLYTDSLVPTSPLGDLSHIVILDIGERGSEWSFYLGSELRHLQRCDVGGQMITQQLAEVFKVDDEMAEMGKMSEARWLKADAFQFITDKNQAQLAQRINEAIIQALLPLKSELIRSFAFSEINLEVPIEAIYLTGGSSELEGIDAYLEAELDIPIRRLSFPEDMTQVLSPERGMGTQDYLAFLMADGLARRLYSNTINFRKNEYSYSRDSGIIRSLAIAVSLTLLCITALQGVRLYFEQLDALAEIAQLEAEVEQLGQSLLGKEGLELDTLKFKVNSSKEKKVLVPEVSAFDTLGELSKFISKDVEVELDRITVSLNPNGRGSLEMQGKTTTVGDVSSVIKAVEKTSCFSERVKKDKVSKSVDERTAFRVTASSKCK